MIRPNLSMLCLGALALAVGCGPLAKQAPSPDVFTVQRGNLLIQVTETGNLDAARSVEYSSGVTRPVQLLELVPEGTQISEEDVRKGKILVRLDATPLETEMLTTQTELDAAQAAYTQAEENVFIQKSTSESDIRADEQAVLFARNAFHKLVGDAIAEACLAQSPATGEIPKILEDARLGGDTDDKLRTLQNDINMAQEELDRARTQLEGTLKLFNKGYVSANDKSADELALKRKELALESARAKLGIYRKYDFLKDFQEALSKSQESAMKLQRTKAVARSKEAQAEAQLNSAKAKYEAVMKKMDDYKANVAKCTIRASQPGIVIYPTSGNRNQQTLQPGDEVRPETLLLKLPDLSEMVVAVDIHESQANLVKEGQPAEIQVDALQKRTFAGRVVSRSIMPSSQNMWLNPDLKVYPTRVQVDAEGMPLRPGMTASVTIHIESLENVLKVPLQAVATDRRNQQFCFLKDGRKVPVRTGKYNQAFVEILDGLKEGDEIQMTPPLAAE